MAFEENDSIFSEISFDLTSGTMIFKKTINVPELKTAVVHLPRLL